MLSLSRSEDIVDSPAITRDNSEDVPVLTSSVSAPPRLGWHSPQPISASLRENQFENASGTRDFGDNGFGNERGACADHASGYEDEADTKKIMAGPVTFYLDHEVEGVDDPPSRSHYNTYTENNDTLLNETYESGASGQDVIDDLAPQVRNVPAFTSGREPLASVRPREQLEPFNPDVRSRGSVMSRFSQSQSAPSIQLPESSDYSPDVRSRGSVTSHFSHSQSASNVQQWQRMAHNAEVDGTRSGGHRRQFSLPSVEEGGASNIAPPISRQRSIEDRQELMRQINNFRNFVTVSHEQ